ncbi:uncharacterized protein [Emydura macquarii macquarii]|uniref:uncharacterized protein n=1 Tax=Emydura macquarii macquarii TaxID=1129001 RepID=UPI00352A24D2
MAAAGELPRSFQDEVTCFYCLEYFTDPMMTECGHNFCRACISQCWRESEPNFPCPQCREPAQQRHLRPNRQLGNVVQLVKRPRLEAVPEPERGRVCERHQEALKLFCEEDQTPICVICRESRAHRAHTVFPIEEATQEYREQILIRLQRLKEEREELQCLKSDWDKESERLLRQTEVERQLVVSEVEQLRQFLAEQERLLLARLGELDEEIGRRREKNITQLCEEISRLSALITELEGKCQQPAHEFLQGVRSAMSRGEKATSPHPVPKSPELEKRIRDFPRENNLQGAVTGFLEGLAAEIVDVTLDPDTANPWLVLSEDRKRVRCGDTCQDLPDNPERFDRCSCVLGAEGFPGGRRYWEVQVGDRPDWEVGVCRESVSRKGTVTLTPGNGYWVLRLWDGEYAACTAPPTSLPMTVRPSRVGIFLDYEVGEVSFYNVTDRSQLFTFTDTFSGTLHPYFDPGYGQAAMSGKVPSFSPGCTVSSALPSYLALCLALQAHRLASAQFTVTGPDHPITTSLGGEAVLPCHLSPRMSAESMELRWFRSRFSAVMHLYRGGQDQYGEQMPEYQGRTELLKVDIANGSVSLRILNIRPSDDGQYKCFFQSGVSYEEALLKLQVAGLGSDPAISVEGHQDGGIRVVCRSFGWFPEPEVLWRDLQGQLLPSASENISQEANGLFQTEAAIVLTEESNRKVSCCVRNPRLNQERESAISIAELFFLRLNPWLVALSVTLALLAGLIPLASYCFWKQHRAKDQVAVKMKVLSFSHSFRACFPLPSFIIFFLTFYVHKMESAKFTVIGSRDPVIATLGQDTVLPCHLSPRMSAANMEVRWFRPELLSFVHLYRDGKDQYKGQMPEYRGRTELLKAGLTDGNVPLRILNIRPSDEGQYGCFVQEDILYEETVLELRVAGLGSAPLISVEGHQDGGIRVVCRSAGWYPEPEVLWKDLNGRHLPSLSETKSRGDNNLFDTETAIIIKKQSNQNLSCCIRNTVLNQDKESAVYIADPFFPRVNSWMVALSVILMVLFVCLIGLVIYHFKTKGKLTEEVGNRDLEIEKRDQEIRWRRHVAPIDEANVILDPGTAHPELILSADGKSVRRAETKSATLGDTRQRVPNNPERFDTELCVLGCEGFTSGRHCWEVEVGGGRHWAVGVARESVRRKEGFILSPAGGIWAVRLLGGQFQTLTSPVTPLPLPMVPSRIRVCLDCDRGQVTFFDAGDQAQTFTFPPASVPGGRIRPWLWVGPGSRLSLCP